MKSVLLIGQNGQVTTYLQRELAEEFELIVADREQLDLTELDAIQESLTELAPDIIVNPAAYTAVDLAEQESDLAFRINHLAVAEIAAYCARSHTPLIHFSTDYVFAGDADTAYKETDYTAPTGVYGASKLAGEHAILDSSAPALILRTAWVYSNHGKNFYKTMLNLAQSRDELGVVADQVGAPTYAGSIAHATKSLLQIIAQQGGILAEQTGVYHFTCGGQTSWCEFAKAIFEANDLPHMQVNGIPSSAYPTPAKRPAFSVLDCSKLDEAFSIQLPDWQEALNACAAQTRATA